MKVLQISPVAPPNKSGMSNAAGEIYKATVKAGASVDLVSAIGDSTVKDLRHLRLPGLGFLAFTVKIVSLCKNYDVIHLHYPCFGNALMVGLARRFGGKKPLIVSYHMDTVGRGLRRPVFWLHSKFLAPHFLKQADKIAVASRDYARNSLLGKHHGLMDKVVEIPFGIDATRFHPAPLASIASSVTPAKAGAQSVGSLDSRPVSRYGACFSHVDRGNDKDSQSNGSSLPPRPTEWGEGRVRGKSILFVGGLDEQHYFKGLHVLMEALATIPGARLTVVGSGNLVKFYARLADKLKIGERVVFAGHVADEALPGYYRDADVFCLPSLDRSEAYGIVLLEAAASGIPAVATDIPGVRSVVKDNETGFLVKPGDAAALAEALKKLLYDRELASKFGQAARAWAETQTWQTAGEKYFELYRSVLPPSP